MFCVFVDIHTFFSLVFMYCADILFSHTSVKQSGLQGHVVACLGNLPCSADSKQG